MSERFGDTKRDRDALDRWITRDRPDDEAVGDPGEEIEGSVAAPIMIPCEGSGGDGHVQSMGVFGTMRMCAMCGAMFFGTVIPAHDRDDILARINRGDYG